MVVAFVRKSFYLLSERRKGVSCGKRGGSGWRICGKDLFENGALLCEPLFCSIFGVAMKQLLVVNHHDSFVYNLIQIFSTASQIECRVVDCELLDSVSLSDFDAVVLSPGPGEVTDYPLSIQLLRFNASSVHPLPVLGVCMGHQQIGTLYGLELYRMEQPAHGEQTTIEWLHNVPALGQQSHSLTPVGRYHSWAVRTPSNYSGEVVVDAIDPQEGTVMALHHSSLPYYGVQFHPESILTPKGKELLYAWLETI